MKLHDINMICLHSSSHYKLNVKYKYNNDLNLQINGMSQLISKSRKQFSFLLRMSVTLVKISAGSFNTKMYK